MGKKKEKKLHRLVKEEIMFEDDTFVTRYHLQKDFGFMCWWNTILTYDDEDEAREALRGLNMKATKTFTVMEDDDDGGK